jgi:hypothetical protein
MGFNTENATKALLLFEGQNNNNACIIKKMVSDYFNEMLLKFEGKTICCSSDIIESCFGKHKELIKNNKSVGISDLCLCMAAMMSPNDLHDTEAAMESKKIEDIKTWRKKNIPPTLFAQKRELMKKCDGTYS